MLNASRPERNGNIFPETLFCGWSFCCWMAALEEIQTELENCSQTCRQSSDAMFHCWWAHHALLDDCVHSPPSNSICQRVIFSKKVSTSNLQQCKTGGFGCSSEGYVMVANRTHSQGQSAALRTCRMCKMFRSEAGAKQKKNPPDQSYTFLFSPKEWAGPVLWGREERRVTRGERESFSWTHFMDVLGSGDENLGG